MYSAQEEPSRNTCTPQQLPVDGAVYINMIMGVQLPCVSALSASEDEMGLCCAVERSCVTLGGCRAPAQSQACSDMRWLCSLVCCSAVVQDLCLLMHGYSVRVVGTGHALPSGSVLFDLSSPSSQPPLVVAML